MKNSKFNTLLSKCDPTAPIPNDLAELLDAPALFPKSIQRAKLLIIV